MHARHRGLIAWWEGDTKREKEDEQLKIASSYFFLKLLLIVWEPDDYLYMTFISISTFF